MARCRWSNCCVMSMPASGELILLGRFAAIGCRGDRGAVYNVTRAIPTSRKASVRVAAIHHVVFFPPTKLPAGLLPRPPAVAMPPPDAFREWADISCRARWRPVNFEGATVVWPLASRLMAIWRFAALGGQAAGVISVADKHLLPLGAVGVPSFVNL